MDMKSLLDKMSQLSQIEEEVKVEEAENKKPDEDGDGVPDWADKKPGKDDNEDKEKVEETSAKMLDKMKDNDLMKSRRDAKKEKEEDKEKVDEAIAIQADGQEAMALLDILKLSGQKPVTASDCACGGGASVEGPGLEMEVEAEEDPGYVNSPDENISDLSAAVPSGNDLHKEKDQYKHNYRGGDNPMAMEEIAKLEGKLKKMFESLSDD